MGYKLRELTKQSLERNLGEYARIDTLLEQMKKQKEAIRKDIMADMQALGTKSETTDYGTFSIRDQSTKFTVDQKLLKTSFPNVFSIVAKESTVKATLQVRKK